MTSAVSRKARIAVDIGGTFTDVALEHAGRLVTAKTLTTQKAPAEGVMTGIRRTLEEAGLGPDAIGLLIHGTTLATNAILERKGAVTALITSEGFRDVLDIGYETRFDQYDLMLEKPKPLVPRERRLVVKERVDVQGRVLTPLDEAGVAALLPALDDAGVESVAIGLLHAYANPAHEQRIAELIAQARPDLWLTLSSEVCPEIREYERFTTASANAYVQPLMARYLTALESELEAAGITAPLLLMTSGGGLATLETARKFPIRLVESGPAGGAILASEVAAAHGLDRVLSFDMGGTTAKICLIEKHRPETAREFEVDRSARFMKGSGLPLRIPVIEMVEIGAGGGSIARIDAMGRIAVGPDSAGADPGPAAYGRGGENSTVTDADAVLGKIDPERFAGGKVALDLDRAAEAIRTKVAAPLGLAAEFGAYGVVEMVDETMANAARVHTVERGKVVAEHSLVAFGGAAPLHAARLAEKLAIDRIVIPANAGVGSAIGFLLAPIAYEIVQSRHMRLARFEPEAANALFAGMRAEAEAVVRAGAPDAPLTARPVAYMRYFGQGHEIVVELPDRPFTDDDAALFQEKFDQAYRQIYRRVIPNAEVEILTWGLTLKTETPPPAPLEDAAPATAESAGERTLFDAERGERVTVGTYWRPDLSPGAVLDGPALIAEEQTSTLVGEGFRALIAADGAIVMERRRGDAR
jgi:N-methylhydantoinase A